MHILAETLYAGCPFNYRNYRIVIIYIQALTRGQVTSIARIEGSAGGAVQAGEDKMLRVWDTRTMEPSATFPVDQYIHVSLCGM